MALDTGTTHGYIESLERKIKKLKKKNKRLKEQLKSERSFAKQLEQWLLGK